MAATSRTASRSRRPVSSRGVKSKGKQEKKTPQSGPKRLLTYLLVVGILLSAFYGFQFFQMSQIRASLDKQIEAAKRSDASDLVDLKTTLEQLHQKYPQADAYSSDPVFTKPPMDNRIEKRNASIFADNEKAIKDSHESTPFLFLTNILMPGAQQSTDDYYRNSIRDYTASAGYKEFNATKLQVDDLMSAVHYCRGEATTLTYGYTDPIPDAATIQLRATVINDAAKRHLCPEKG